MGTAGRDFLLVSVHLWSPRKVPLQREDSRLLSYGFLLVSSGPISSSELCGEGAWTSL